MQYASTRLVCSVLSCTSQPVCHVLLCSIQLACCIHSACMLHGQAHTAINLLCARSGSCSESVYITIILCKCACMSCRPAFEKITKELQVLYQQCRKKPLQSASSAPMTLEQKLRDRRSTGPPAPSSGPLRVRPSTADISDLTPKVGRSAFKSVTEPQGAHPRSTIQSVAELDEEASVNSDRASQASQAPQQAPPPPTAPGIASPFAQEAAEEQAANGAFGREIPTVEEAEQRMAAAPTPIMPPASEMRGNARSSTSWRGPSFLQQK